MQRPPGAFPIPAEPTSHKGDSNPFESRSCPSHMTGVAGNEAQRAQSINDACLSAGGSGCKLCPTDWQLRGDKCYWVSRGRKTWSESRADCSARDSQLLVIQDPEELEFIKDLTKHSHLFWIGLSISSSEKAWIWVDGSRLDQSLFQAPGPAENSCGAVWGKWIHSDACSSGLHWIWLFTNGKEPFITKPS
uniref:C-type lectin domain-containing protein n=1 Tax=Terrapene triunguis TaxID=2587831 RepID=A0A674J789_9SAUR